MRFDKRCSAVSFLRFEVWDESVRKGNQTSEGAEILFGKPRLNVFHLRRLDQKGLDEGEAEPARPLRPHEISLSSDKPNPDLPNSSNYDRLYIHYSRTSSCNEEYVCY